MPIFEYMCVRCGTNFEQLVRGSGEQEIVCPQCMGNRVIKQFSTFAVRGSKSSRPGGGAGACAPGGG
jgi:putative FmdB family regulatory protein